MIGGASMFEKLRRRQEQRSQSRRPVNCSATLHQNAQSVDCVVRDISLTGAQLLVADPPEPHTEIALKIERVGFVEGIVRWRDGHRIGASFENMTPATEQRIAKL
jgi:hypothetical protein